MAPRKKAATKPVQAKEAVVETKETAEVKEAAVEVKEAEEVKAEAAAPKKTAAKKTTTKKAAAKAELSVETMIQFAGKEVTEKDVLKQVKEVWTKELKKKVGDMKKVQIYVKPEESAAYYVINEGEAKGKIEL